LRGQLGQRFAGRTVVKAVPAPGRVSAASWPSIAAEGFGPVPADLMPRCGADPAAVLTAVLDRPAAV
jgi:hypothetical protein